MSTPYPNYQPSWLVAENILVRREAFDKDERCNWTGCNEEVQIVQSSFNPDFLLRACRSQHPQANIEQITNGVWSLPEDGPYHTTGSRLSSSGTASHRTPERTPSKNSASYSVPESISSPSSVPRATPSESHQVAPQGPVLPRIYNRRNLTVGVDPPGAIYVGRPSPWGNPFRMRSEADRDRVCDQFESYAVQHAANEPKWLDPLRGKDLVDWCCNDDGEGNITGSRCHAQTLRRLANS